MIIRFEDAHGENSHSWAYQEGVASMPREPVGDPEGNEVVGDRSYAGTQGQTCRARLMDQLFDSPDSDAQHREG